MLKEERLEKIIEIVQQEKVVTVNYLSEKLNVNLSEVISFGDNYNDMDMLKCTGMPIAMENAVEDAKKAAKYVTKTNNESGVAYAINNFILADQKI